MVFPNGKRQLKAYKTTQDSFEDFKTIWKTKYSGGFPSYYEVQQWTGNPKPDDYIAGLKSIYYN